MTVPVILALMAAVLLGIVGLAILILVNKQSRAARSAYLEGVARRLAAHRAGEPLGLTDVPDRTLLDCFIRMKQDLSLPPEAEADIVRDLERRGKVAANIRRLRSRRAITRIEAANRLAYLATPDARRALAQAFANERSPVVRYRLAVALSDVDRDGNVATLLQSLEQSSPWYFDKVAPLVLDGGQAFYDLIPGIPPDSDPRIGDLLLRFAARYPAADLKDRLVRAASGSDDARAVLAAEGLAALYPQLLADDRYLVHPSLDVRRIAIDSLAATPSREHLDTLLALLGSVTGPALAPSRLEDGRTEAYTIHAVAELLGRQPSLMPVAVRAFCDASEPWLRRALAEIVSFRIQYFFVKLMGRDRDRYRTIVTEVLATGRTSEAIGFLNRNRNREVENEILSAIRDAIEQNPAIVGDLRHYLDPRVLAKLNLAPLTFPSVPRVEQRYRARTVTLWTILIALIFAFPALYLLRHWDGLPGRPIRTMLVEYVIDFNWLLVFYSAALQVVTIVLLVCAYAGARGQLRRWRAKPQSLLFRPGALPSISILAPAYREEATIVESANSLLNVAYPDVELVIVNDGSPDGTLDRLIEHFALEKVDRFFPQDLPAKPVRGIYANPQYPRLVVVDKENGGKADSLNAGINVASKEYFCGIDADSLLEADSLLKVACGGLDTEAEVVASGGNIMPINGCSVDRGTLTKIELPRSRVARFQTIEYIRAFMAGRVGWAQLKSLLIISGAFGLFSRQRVIDVGGYLTEAGQYGRDTVGEDMELVVRLKRSLLQARVPHEINYAFNANCWTEVPEDLTVLHRQRDRWQRGLIDILFVHRRMAFNPRYGRTGTIALPYFYIFEMVGPLVELQGYAMVVLAAALGLLNVQIALLLFLTVILMGVLVSMFSLFVAEMETDQFSTRGVVTLIAYAVIENFGFRQLTSWWRVSGYLSSLRKPKGWGQMERKGFSAPPTAPALPSQRAGSEQGADIPTVSAPR